MLTDVEIVALGAELSGDPGGIGYSAMSNGQALAAMNIVRAGGGYIVDKGAQRAPGVVVDTILGQDIVEATLAVEFATLAESDQRLYTALVARESLILTDAMKTKLGNMFLPMTTTRANLIQLSKRQGSRAEVLFGTNIDIDDIRKARAL